jgi:hypothetical protein
LSDLRERLAATRQRPLTVEEAKKSAQRLIDAAFHNTNRPQPEFSIPVRGDNDDVFLMEYLDCREAELAQATADALEAAARHFPKLEWDREGDLYEAKCACGFTLSTGLFHGEHTFDWIEDWQKHIRALVPADIAAKALPKSNRF